jgi:heme A synthase
MKFLTTITITAFIALLLYLTLDKSSKVIAKRNSEDKEKKLRNQTIIATGLSIAALLIGKILFDNKGFVSNPKIKNGIYLGATYLLLESVIYKWGDMNDKQKLTILSGSLIATLIVSYQ